jgi:hypothetical protein
VLGPTEQSRITRKAVVLSILNDGACDAGAFGTRTGTKSEVLPWEIYIAREGDCQSIVNDSACDVMRLEPEQYQMRRFRIESIVNDGARDGDVLKTRTGTKCESFV